MGNCYKESFMVGAIWKFEKQKVIIDVHQVLIKVLEIQAVLKNPVGVSSIMNITLSLRVILEAQVRNFIEESQF